MFTHPVPAGCTPHVPNPISCPSGSAAWDWCCACRVKPGAPRVSVTLAPARFFSMVIPGKLSLLSSNACCQRGRAGAIKGVQEGCVTAASSRLVSPLCSPSVESKQDSGCSWGTLYRGRNRKLPRWGKGRGCKALMSRIVPNSSTRGAYKLRWCHCSETAAKGNGPWERSWHCHPAGGVTWERDGVAAGQGRVCPSALQQLALSPGLTPCDSKKERT